MDKKLKEVVVVAYGRSPIARAFKGSLKDMHPVDYAAQVLQGVLAKVPLLNKEEIEDVVVGCAKPEGVQSYNIGRLIAMRAGLPPEVAGQTINRFCSSGLQAISTAANMIMTGQAEIMVAGGVEDMTAIPMGAAPETRCKWISDTIPELYMSMGLTAENVAEQHSVTRLEMDEFAVASHKKAFAAQQFGYFDDQIIPIEAYDAEGNTFAFTKDEGIRGDSSVEKLATLKTVFKEDGVVTAGQASQMSDGASFIVMMSREKAESLKIKPIAEFVTFSMVGVPPEIMGIGPIKAVPKALRLADLSINDINVIELNEAFAAQAIPCIRELGLDPERVNPYGGAIALGHPMGATGGILTCKVLSALARGNGTYGMVTLCIGLGMGAAAIYKKL